MMTTWDAVSAFDRMFDDVMGSSLGAATNRRTFDPEVDVRISEEEVLVVCDVPGVKHDDLDVTVQNRVLTIRGARKFESKEREQVMLGRSYGSFVRSFTLPATIDEGKLSAKLADGVLTISIPKHPKPQPIKVQITGGGEPGKLGE